MRDLCTRCAFTGGPCSGYCPGLAEYRAQQFNQNATIRNRGDRLTLAAVWAIAFFTSLTVLTAAAHFGLGRTEREYQQQARV